MIYQTDYAHLKERSMTSFSFQAAQKNSVSLCSSAWQFKDVLPSFITEQSTPSYVLIVNMKQFRLKVFNEVDNWYHLKTFKHKQ